MAIYKDLMIRSIKVVYQCKVHAYFYFDGNSKWIWENNVIKLRHCG